MQNEEVLVMVEHAIDYLADVNYPDDSTAAIKTLYAAHRAVGPLGEIPYWESQGA